MIYIIYMYIYVTVYTYTVHIHMYIFINVWHCRTSLNLSGIQVISFWLQSPYFLVEFYWPDTLLKHKFCILEWPSRTDTDCAGLQPSQLPGIHWTICPSGKHMLMYVSILSIVFWTFLVSVEPDQGPSNDHPAVFALPACALSLEPLIIIEVGRGDADIPCFETSCLTGSVLFVFEFNIASNIGDKLLL